MKNSRQPLQENQIISHYTDQGESAVSIKTQDEVIDFFDVRIQKYRGSISNLKKVEVKEQGVLDSISKFEYAIEEIKFLRRNLLTNKQDQLSKL